MLWGGCHLKSIHEQNNALVKSTAGAVGLTENPNAFQQWMTSGPEVGRLLQEFETSFLHISKPTHHHHEQVPSIQYMFAKEVSAVVVAYDSKGNPNMEQSDDLITVNNQ